ncbi:hypothetical protein [Marinobacterium rhizophilum]|uniref:YubB ferredoxin-like domain-containing protein n=1 Tax=Marinobacterium rhizophilum TaxID=420402 RepID=A0ABY5HMP2_9GAMM|nr:hypothetical protein [Marinobacterium rhizophilum]UTW13374.1 hypothetical protein KDW95_06900 [Marinobacterium rhizophilum]
MDKFTFNRGTWEDGNSLSDWQDDEEFGQYLERNGFSPFKKTYGDENSTSINIYTSKHTCSFYADVCLDGGSIYEVLLPDFPSMMMFIKDYGSVVTAVTACEYQQDTLNLHEKRFLVEHGHPTYDICDQCDPVTWEQRLQRHRG